MRKYRGVLLGALLALGVAGTALAEGEFYSSMSNVLIGFDSRTWNDKNSDANETKITLAQCRDSISNGPNDWVILELWKHNFIFPGSSKGLRPFYCYSTATQSWGRQENADYNFEVQAFSGPVTVSNNLDVQIVWVRW